MELLAGALLQFVALQKECPKAAGQLVQILSGLKEGLRSGLQTGITVDLQLGEGDPDTLEFGIFHDLKPEGKSLDEKRILRFMEKNGGHVPKIGEISRFYCALPGYRLRLNRSKDRLEYDPKAKHAQGYFEITEYISTVVNYWKSWMKKAYSVDLDARGKIS